jgi:hypothetical protein
MSYHCPSCHGVLYDRRRKTCGFCGVELPVELLFTTAELERLHQEEAQAEERRRHERAKEEEEAEAQARAKAASDIFIPPIS